MGAGFFDAMEQNELRKWEAKCTQEEPPRCKAGCPLNVDARGFVQAMTQGRLQEARAVLEKSMPIPAITASLCEAPCEEHCLRKDLGGSVAVGLLERNCLSRTISRAKSLRLPPRQKSVAIIGGGPSCLVCAYDLGRKGYPVTIFASGSPTGWLQELPEDRLPAQRVSEEIQKLTKNGVVFRMSRRLIRRSSLNSAISSTHSFSAATSLFLPPLPTLPE